MRMGTGGCNGNGIGNGHLSHHPHHHRGGGASSMEGRKGAGLTYPAQPPPPPTLVWPGLARPNPPRQKATWSWSRCAVRWCIIAATPLFYLLRAHRTLPSIANNAANPHQWRGVRKKWRVLNDTLFLERESLVIIVHGDVCVCVFVCVSPSVSECGVQAFDA